MTLSAMVARTARRNSPLLRHPTVHDRTRRVRPFGLLVFDFDLSAVVLDMDDICADLDEGFSRGPFVSVSGEAPRPAVRIAPLPLAATPFA